MTTPRWPAELALVAHADWSWSPAGRALCVARRQPHGWSLALAPAEPADDLLARLLALAAHGTVVLGLDAPIGLPRAYAAARGIQRFPSWLAGLADDDPFFMPADAATVALTRPFFPARPGGASRALLVQRLGLAAWADLLRRCDGPTSARPGASCTFWTLGPQQCGKAALSVWRDLLKPAWRDRRPLALWPYDGELADLAAARPLTAVETYPAECYGQLGLPARLAKRTVAGRAAQAAGLLAISDSLAAVPDASLQAAILDGFASAGADHAFDAFVGTLALLQVLGGQRPAGAPTDPLVRNVEGWMLGLDASSLLPSSPTRS